VKRRQDNKSGISGVSRRIIKGIDYFIVQCSCLTGKRKSKAFNVKEYGEQEAFRLACEYRAKMIEELNAAGAGYTGRHGT
jgi:hypothetical protein